MKNLLNQLKISIIGLGYVGLPIALEFGKRLNVVAYDINKKRINELKKGFDQTKEIKQQEISAAKKIFFSNKISDLKKSDFFIICVPTPVNRKNKPDLKNLINITKKIAKIMDKGNTVVYESTFYPGLTEEICAPTLEKYSKLKYNKDFFCGYSPERINPGDNKLKLKNINKLVAGSNKKTLDKVYNLYNLINPKKIIKVKSIKIAEAAKIIENCQRDINIAFMNELSKLFYKMNIDTYEVLKAASTKWNFINFKPGLVGGHCIGVDPYYLSHKAELSGYKSKIILSGRKINNSMSKFVVDNFIKGMKDKEITVANSNILILGLTFKENCSDIRNSKVFEIISLLQKKQIRIDVYDPWVKDIENKNFKLINKIGKFKYDGVLLAVAHNKFKKISLKKIKTICKSNFFLYDLKNFFNSKIVDLKL